MTAEYCKTLEEIAKPFIESGLYNSVDAFVGNLLRDVAERKIRTYTKKIAAYETKYGPFEAFTKKIQGKASPRQENQWMEWEAAINMLDAWKQVTRELDSSAS